jgi:hypothetical protein
MNSSKESTTQPNELAMISHSRYHSNVFLMDEIFSEDMLMITARGSVGTTVSMRTGDAEHLVHGMGRVQKG